MIPEGDSVLAHTAAAPWLPLVAAARSLNPKF